ncbi:MAG: hypothetical protein PT977_08160 [Acidobacteriota bacterium]|nr:hypothetical protein [Acidobacteriota bacterium]
MTTAICPELESTREAVRLRLTEEISFSSERALKSHLASCGSCTPLARALDPTLLFVPLGTLGTTAAAAVSAEDVRRVTDDVLAEVRRRTRVSAPVPARPVFSRRFLQAAALVALAAGLFGVQGIRRAKDRAASSAELAAGMNQAVAPEAEIPAARPSVRPLIQDLKNPAARVYEFAALSAKEPSVVFIADPHADL